MFDEIKNKVADMLGVDTVADTVDGLTDKVGDVLGENAEQAADTAVNKVEDMIENTLGVDVDLNNDETAEVATEEKAAE